ncbi:MAG: hypothetical protein KAS19_12700 [Anaerolineales bacterium]|nr:hypothetical protein [Anaerolineales bacterium]
MRAYLIRDGFPLILLVAQLRIVMGQTSSLLAASVVEIHLAIAVGILL